MRTLKSQILANDRRHKDVLISLAIMKREDEFKNVIHDMGYDPFFVHYCSAEQIQIYRSYCNSTKYSKLVLDATGSIVKPFHKFGLDKTKTLYLYEALVYDKTKNHSFTVTNMISESHTNNAILNWLLKWISLDVKKPKETVCDNSLALLSALVQSFTQYTSLQAYIRVCSDLLTNKLDSNSHWVPQCFVRIDVAHFINICSKWTSLKSVSRRVKEIILRVVGLLIKSKSLSEVHSLLYSIFVVLSNETDGLDLENAEETPCEIHRKRIIEATSTGFVLFQQQFDDIIANAESENDARDLLDEEYESQEEGLGEFENPFQTWAENIYNRSKNLIREGSGINPLYIPALIPVFIKIIKLLPLWSGVMIPIFRYGDDISSSAAIESSFKKLKTVTFKNISLPTSIETFLDNHIKSLKGASLLRSFVINKNSSCILNESYDKNNDINKLNTLPPPFIFDNNVESRSTSPYALLVVDKSNEDNNSKSLNLTNNKNFENDHEFPFLEFIEIPSNISELTEENRAEESWNRKSKKERKNNSYLNQNPHLRHLNIRTAGNQQSLPILKNGSRFDDLKSTRNNIIPGKVIFTNTCAFDTLSSLIMVCYLLF